MKRRYKSQVKIPRDKEDWFIKDVNDDIFTMLNELSDLDGDQEMKDHIAEGIGHLGDVIESLVNMTSLPKRGLKRPWDVSKMN